ncbi:hypothetical protein MATL_G00194190 [Megalops atlanticus]|uniref:OTU domain-containing protein 4 n=1 Tax=Megalops atlanticus TaxID=7932 RepID=A0A9D3PLH0_MEGAT|nr:hypothetical protein MATL_G00194190 [Megalops atlanticus]
MEAGSEDMQANDKGVEKLMDEYLKSKGFYRKKIAKDGSCLFRAVAEQVLHCQSRHTEVRATCVDYLKENRTKYESFIEGNFEEYLHRLEDPQNWVGEVEISALALIYRHDFIIFQEPGKPPVNITENNFTDKVRLCFLNGNHYDSVYPLEFIKTAALCQSILYELLYERVYGVDHSVVATYLARRGDPEDGGYGECKSSEESDLEDNEDFWPNEAAVPSNMNSRRIPNSNQTCKTAKSHPSRVSLSQRVQMSLNPSFFRNVEYDVWLRSQRVQQKRDFCMAAGMQYSVGDKCKVRLDNTGRFYSAYIQAVDPENGPVTVFIEELGKKHTIPLWDLRPSSGDGESWSTVAERGKRFSLVNGNGHHSERDTRGGRKPGKGPQSPHAPAAAGRVQKQHSWPPQATVDEHATGRTLHATARKGEPGTSVAPAQEPHFGLSPDERLAREEEEKSQALLEIMHRDEKSFPALGSQGVSRSVTQTGDGGKRSQNSERRGSKKKGDPQPQEASGDSEAKDLAVRSGQRAEQTKLSGKCAGQLEPRSPSADHNQAVQRHVPAKEDSARSGSSLGPQSAERGPPPEPSRAAAPTSAPAPAPPTPTSVSAPASTAAAPALPVPAPSAPTQTAPSTTPPTSTTPAPSTFTPSAIPAPADPAPSKTPTSTATAPSSTPALPPPVSTASAPPPPTPTAASSAPTPPAHTSTAPAPASAPAPPLSAPSLAPATPSPVSVAAAVPPPVVPNHHPPPLQQIPAPLAGFPSAPPSGDPSPYEGPNSNSRGVMPLAIAPAPATPPVLPEHMPNHHAPSPSAPPPGPLPFHQISHLFQDPLYPGFPLNDKDEMAPTPPFSLMRNGQDLPKEMGVLRFFFNLGVKAYLTPMWPPHTYIYPLLQAHMSACAMQPKLPCPAPFVTPWYSETSPPGPVLRMSAVTMQEGYGHAPAYGHGPPPGGRPPGQFEHAPCPVPPGVGVGVGVGVGMGVVGGALAPQHAELGLGSESRPAMGYSPQPAAATLPPVMGGVPWPGPRPNTFPGAFPARPPPPPPAQYLPPPPQFPPVTPGYPAPRMSGGIPNIALQVKSGEAPGGRGVGQTLTERPPAVPSTDPEKEAGKERRVATPLTGPPRPASVPREQAPPTADHVTAGSGEAKGKARPVYVVVSTPDTGPTAVPPTQSLKVSFKEGPGSAEVGQAPASANRGEDGAAAPGGGPKEGESQGVEPGSEPQVYRTAYSSAEVWEEEGEPGEAALRGGRSYYRSSRGRRGYDDGRGYRDTRWRGEGRGYRGRRGPDDRREYSYRERRSGESSPGYPGTNMKGPNVRGRGPGYSPYPPGRESGYTVVYQRSSTYADS